jgi:hypothetical protein
MRGGSELDKISRLSVRRHTAPVWRSGRSPNILSTCEVRSTHARMPDRENRRVLSEELQEFLGLR